MKTIYQLSTLALAIMLSAGTAQAQQTVKKTTKAPVRHSVVRPASTQTVKPVVAASTEQATSSTQPVSEPGANQAPIVARQTEARSQATTQPASTRRVTKTSGAHRSLLLNAGIGVATYYGGGFPIGASLEANLKNNFSVGGSVDFFRYNYGYYSGNYTFVLGGARASYHLSEVLNVQNSNFDPYVGATLGFRYANYHDSYGYSYSDYGAGYNSGLWLGIHVGARYFFSPKVGGFAEVGYGVSALKLGVTAKF